MENEKENNYLTMESVTQNLFQLVVAGVDTTSNTFMNTLNILVNHPEIQDKAYEEIVKVVGNHRLPNHADEIPYIDALVTESMRFRPLFTPGGIPHTTVEEDTYEGYRIPAGTPVVFNNHIIHFDPTLYKDPLVFNPDRYLMEEDLGEKPVRKPHYGFGAGPRICPGQAFSEMSLFLTIARLLCSFKLLHPLDVNGQENPVPLMGTDGVLFSFAPRSKIRFVPRHENMDSLIGEFLNTPPQA
jgi:cytochrome P450